MNLRKFFLVLNIIVSVFLFSLGTFFLYDLNASSDDGDNSSILGKVIGHEVLDPFKNPKDPINILVLGGDKVNKNSDTMILVNFNPQTAEFNMLSIPRDTKVMIRGAWRKINYAFPAGGPELAVETVSNLLDVNIKYYVFIDITSAEDIIDLLGGVKFDVPFHMKYTDPLQNLYIDIPPGQQVLNGEQVVDFMRFRQANIHTSEVKKYYDGSDLKRIEAQQRMLQAIIEQKASFKYIDKFDNVIQTVFSGIDTNIKIGEALKLSQNISKLDMSNIQMMSLPGRPYDASPWYFLHDPQECDEIIEEYFKGKGSFADIDKLKDGTDQGSHQPSNTNNSGIYQSPKKPVTQLPNKPAPTPTPKPVPTPTKSVIDGNPSNDGTSLDGDGLPKP